MTEQEYLAQLDELQGRRWPQGFPREPSYPFGEVPLTEYLRRWAARQPDKAAYVFYGHEISFGELDRQSDAFARALTAQGIVPGDRVAVFLPNCPQFAVAFYGILKCGAVHVPVNPMFKEAELSYELNDSGARLILALDQLMPLVRTVRDRTPLETAWVTSLADVCPAEPTLPLPASLQAKKIECPDARDLYEVMAGAAEGPAPCADDLDTIAALNYTGGTTGMPKGCVHTQRNMLYKAACANTVATNTGPDDITLNFLPMFWIAGESLSVIFPIFTGGTHVLLTRWDPIAFMAAIERYRVTSAGGLVDNIAEVLEHPDVLRYDFSSLRRVRVSSFVKKLSIGLRRRWQELTGTVLVEGSWGMTETHTFDTFTTGMQEDDLDLKSQPVFVGLPMPGTQFKICDFETGELKSRGEEGEICCRSPSLLKSYWNKPEASAQALRNGWLHSGDIGLIDSDGYLHFLGRRKEMLKVNGMSVFPGEIEALLGQHPQVLGSAVIGRPDDRRGQVPVAFVLLAEAARDSLSLQDLTKWCADSMAGYKVPEIRFVDALPMTTTGKVKKEELSHLLEPSQA